MQRLWRIAKTGVTFVGAVSAVIGLAGIPDDLTNWATWLQPFNSELGRWLLGIVGLTILAHSVQLVELARRFPLRQGAQYGIAQGPDGASATPRSGIRTIPNSDLSRYAKRLARHKDIAVTVTWQDNDDESHRCSLDIINLVDEAGWQIAKRQGQNYTSGRPPVGILITDYGPKPSQAAAALRDCLREQGFLVSQHHGTRPEAEHHQLGIIIGVRNTD